MKYRIIIDKDREEEALIYAHERSELVERLEALLSQSPSELIGYGDREAVILNPDTVLCFTVENGSSYAVTEEGKYRLRLRLYQIEEKLSSDYVKINQSCIVNVGKIERFKASVGGSLKVILKGGFSDYVSRRQLRAVKERLGI